MSIQEIFYNLGVFFKSFVTTIGDVVTFLFTPYHFTALSVIGLENTSIMPIYLISGTALILILIWRIVRAVI